MFSIEFRRPDTGRTLFETDDREVAEWVLTSAVEVPGTELVDFSGNLDGVLDETLAGVKLFPADEPAPAVLA